MLRDWQTNDDDSEATYRHRLRARPSKGLSISADTCLRDSREGRERALYKKENRDRDRDICLLITSKPSPAKVLSADKTVCKASRSSAVPCTSGKTAYASPQAAWAAMRAVVAYRYRRPKRQAPGKPGVYQCPMCHAWHTTSAKGRAA